MNRTERISEAILSNVMNRYLFVLLLFIPACAPWIGSRGTFKSPSHHFSVDIPQTWMRLKSDQYLLISRDGPFLQYVLVQERPIARPFKHTKKKLRRGMLPQEAAQVIVDEISCDQSVLDFQVKENTPARVNEYEGFRLRFTHKNRDGLTFKTVYYGFLIGDRFYSARYNAAKRYYFDKDRATFEKLLKSLRLERPT